MMFGAIASHYVDATPPPPPPGGAYSTEVMNDTPLVYWRLGESSGTTAADASGNGRSGTYTTPLTLGAASLLGSDANTSVDFSGGYAQIAYNAAWMAPAAWTVEFLFNADVLGAQHRILAARHASGAPSWDIGTEGGNLKFRFYNGASWVAIVYAVTIGTTYHVAATWDGTTRRLFVDGTERVNAAGGFAASTAPLTAGNLGSAFGGAAYGHDGRLDEFAYYGTALTAARISAHNAAR